MSLPGCGLAHAVSAKKRRIAKQSGRRIVEMVKEDLTPRKIMTRGGPPQRDQGEYGDGRVHQQHTPSSGYRP